MTRSYYNMVQKHICPVCGQDITCYGCGGSGRIPKSALSIEMIDHAACNGSGTIPHTRHRKSK